MQTEAISTTTWIKSLQSPQIAAQFADHVDRDARFPHEAVAAFKAEKLLSAPVPTHLGGMGLNMRGQGELVAAVAAQCGSSAMVLAMHYSQLACLTRNTPDSEFFAGYLRELCEQQLLLSSITSEVGTYGSTRTSICAVLLNGDHFSLSKEATTGSYCDHSDAILVTARKSVDAQAGDQVLVLVKNKEVELQQTTQWDTMGMRGTCSPGFSLKCEASAAQIFPIPFSEIASQSMVPFSHTLWSALWWGLAYSAYDKAATLVRGQARKNPGVVPASATRLAELMVKVQTMRYHWQGVADEFDALVASQADKQSLQELGWALKFNSLKTAASQMSTEIIHDALLMLGIPGYSNHGPLSISRTYRDALSGALMISNERIAAKSASMLLVFKDQ